MDCYICGNDIPAGSELVLDFGIDPDTGYQDEIRLCGSCAQHQARQVVDQLDRWGR